jgi:metal-responsive CopG/Arc/MetJ family transcriptional regulator
MRTVQMTLNDDLVEKVDIAARLIKTTRSGFTRMALELALKDQFEKQLIKNYQTGYKNIPVKKGEFDNWETEQDWGDK